MTEADRKVFVQDASELKDKFATQRKVLLRPEADQAIDEAQPQDVDKGLVQEHIPKPIPDSGTNQECEPQVESILGSAGTCLASGAFPGEWQVLRFLGGGTYGYVFEVADRWGGARLAAKIAGRENTLQDLDAERRLLERLVHPNIVRSFGFAASSAHAALLLELAQSDLATWLAVPCNKVVRDSLPALDGRWRLLYQLTSAMQYMHSSKVLHLDFKTNNVLVFEASGVKSVKVADFGMSQALTDDGLKAPGDAVFTLSFRPPELVLAEKSVVKVSYSGGVYALGCCMYDLFRCSDAGPLLFPSNSLFELMLQERRRMGTAAAYQTFARYRDQRLEGSKTRLNSRVTDAMAIGAIKEIVAPLPGPMSLQALETRIRMRISSLTVG